MSDLSDPQKLKRRESLDNIHRRQELNDIAHVLSTLTGRRFFWRLLQRCGVFKSSFTGNNTTFFNEGERNIGLILLTDLNEADPNAYMLMIQESRIDDLKNEHKDTKKEEATHG